jgi:hypothetical protein
MRLDTMSQRLGKAGITIALLILCNGIALGQSDSRRGWGYAVGGAGVAADDGSVGLFNIAGGGEALFLNGLGLGGEIGLIGGQGNALGLFSGNVSYHFGGRDSSRKWSPFATGGYSLGFRSGGAASGGNFGGGVQYWVSDRVALRFEFRDHVFSSDRPHTLAFRFGLSFR